MKTFVNFTYNGREALGSDAWFQLDGRNRLDVQIEDARKRMSQLRRVKSYDGFRIIRAENLRGTSETVIYSE